MAHFHHIKDIFEFCDIFSQLVANYLRRFFLMFPQSTVVLWNRHQLLNRIEVSIFATHPFVIFDYLWTMVVVLIVLGQHYNQPKLHPKVY